MGSEMGGVVCRVTGRAMATGVSTVAARAVTIAPWR
jgi:hypothetical protein